MKPGWKTSEFWVTIFCQLAGIGVVMGYLTPEQVQAGQSAIAQIAGGIIMAVSGVGYFISRGIAKLHK